MRKIFNTGLAILGVFSLFSCDRTNEENKELKENQDVVARDTIVTEYEVEETVVEYDTTKRTKTVDADVEENDENR